MAEWQGLTRTEHAGLSTQCCVECGIADTCAKLEADEDSQLYCTEYWDAFYGTLIAAAESIAERLPLVSTVRLHPDDSFQPSTGGDFDASDVTSDAVVVPRMDYCSQCGASATESKLEMDDDDQYYCTDCWETHDSALIAACDSADDEEDPLPSVLARSDSMPSLIDWPSDEPVSVVVPASQCCVECGASERESKLVLDDDGEYYCTDCWDGFLSTASDDSGSGVVSEDLGLPD